MATAKKIQSDISSLKIAIRVAKNDAIKKKLKSRLEMAENELASIKSGAKPRKVSTTKGTKSLLERAKALVKKNPKFASYKGSGVDLEKDAKEGALPIGRRVSKGIKGNQFASKDESKGNVYYEYRVNRLDVKQPKKKQTYPKLADGGMMARGGYVSKGELVWKKLSGSKKMEFLEENFKKQITDRSKEILVNKDFQFLPKDVKIKFEAKYANVEEYADGGMMAKGGIYSSDSLYILTVSKDGKEVAKERFRAKSMKEARMMGEDMEDGYKSQFGGDLSFSISEAMAGGGYMAKGDKLDVGVYRVGKPNKVSPMLYEQKIVEIFENGDISTASDYARKLSGFNLQKYPIISKEQLDAQYKMANGGSMAKGGEVIPYIIWVSKDGEKREFYGDYKSQRAAEMAMKKLWDSSDYKAMGNKPKKMYEKDGFYKYGGYMAKGGAVEHGLKVGDIVKLVSGDMIAIYNPREKSSYRIDISKGERKKSDFNFNKYADGGYMAHGGETHRAEDPEEVEIEEDEMKVIRGYSDDEAYEYAKGGMTLKAGDIVEATTGVKLKVMDFKPDFGGRALVQRIDEFGEGLKPAWMPLTKFKLPKLI